MGWWQRVLKLAGVRTRRDQGDDAARLKKAGPGADLAGLHAHSLTSVSSSGSGSPVLPELCGTDPDKASARVGGRARSRRKGGAPTINACVGAGGL